MTDFQWHEQYRLGVAALDEPHRRLLDLAGELAQCIRAGASKEDVAASVHALAQFTAAHFTEEERLMASCGFSDNLVHAEHHGELLDQLERFAARVISHNSPDDAAKTLGFLRDWAANHILHSDRQLAAHLLSHRER